MDVITHRVSGEAYRHLAVGAVVPALNEGVVRCGRFCRGEALLPGAFDRFAALAHTVVVAVVELLIVFHDVFSCDLPGIQRRRKQIKGLHPMDTDPVSHKMSARN